MVPVQVAVYREKFYIGIFAQIFWGTFYTCGQARKKILNQKVNVKFFTVGPYVPLALVRQTILKKRVLAKYIFLKYQQKTKPPQNEFPKRLYGGQLVFDVI